MEHIDLIFKIVGCILAVVFTTTWSYGFSDNEALYFGLEGLSLMLHNRFKPNVPFLYLLKTWEIQRFSAVLKGYRNGVYTNRVYTKEHVFCKSVAVGTQVLERSKQAKKLVLYGNGNLVLSSGCNWTMWKWKFLECVLQVWNSLFYFKYVLSKITCTFAS